MNKNNQNNTSENKKIGLSATAREVPKLKENLKFEGNLKFPYLYIITLTFLNTKTSKTTYTSLSLISLIYIIAIREEIKKMFNVDTLTLGISYKEYIKVDRFLPINIKSRLSKEYNEDLECYCYKGKTKGYSFYYITKFYYLLVTLQHYRVEKYTDTEIINNTRDIITKYFDIPIKYIQKIYLNRIDYKNDYLCPSYEHKLIINDLSKIAPEIIGKSYTKEIFKARYISYTSKNNNSNNDNTNNSNNNNNNTDDEDYPLNGGNASATFYDKEEERLDKGDIEGAEEFKNVFRSEVKIKNKKLNSNKYNDGTLKELGNYYKQGMAQQYFDEYVSKIFFKQPFYRIDIATKRIKDIVKKEEFEKAKEKKKKQILKIRNINKPKSKEKIKLVFPRKKLATQLINLLNNILNNGYTKAKESYKCETVFKNHIKKLQELNINPLTYSQLYELEKIDNFSLLIDEESEENKNPL